MDGTTATTLAPSEEDMQKVTEVFARMRDAVISASRLAVEVNELRNSVGALRNELETLRRREQWADEQITGLRVARDEALATCNRQAAEIVNIRNDRDSLQVHCDNQRETLARLNEQVAELRKERDDAQFLAEVLKGDKEELQGKLDTIVGLVCPKGAEPAIGTVPMPPPNVDQPRDPETQQFKSWDDKPSWEN